MYLTDKPINIFQPSVNIGNVSDYLSASNRDISENANKCKEFIQMHMNSNKSNGPPNMAALMSFINGKVEDKLSEIDINVTEEIAAAGAASHKVENGETNEQNDCVNFSAGPLPFGLENSIDLVKTYFDSKFREIEDKLMNKIDERFRDLEKKQDEKFNQILGLLQK